MKELSSNINTGDDIEIWIGLMTVSVIGIIGTVIFVKKKEIN